MIKKTTNKKLESSYDSVHLIYINYASGIGKRLKYTFCPPNQQSKEKIQYVLIPKRRNSHTTGAQDFVTILFVFFFLTIKKYIYKCRNREFNARIRVYIKKNPIVSQEQTNCWNKTYIRIQLVYFNIIFSTRFRVRLFTHAICCVMFYRKSPFTNIFYVSIVIYRAGLRGGTKRSRAS